MKTVAVIGAHGFVGQALCHAFENASYRVTKVIRGDDIRRKISSSKIVLHAANPAKRFWAEQNPELDHKESVQKTMKIIKSCADKKLLLISSLSARTQLETVYGRHRNECEQLLDHSKSLIVRLGPMFGQRKVDGALGDILNERPVYVSGDSEYAFVSVEYAAQKVVELVEQTGVIEIGARNGIKLQNLADALGSKSVFAGKNDTQIPNHPLSDAPLAEDVLTFARNQLRRGDT